MPKPLAGVPRSGHSPLQFARSGKSARIFGKMQFCARNTCKLKVFSGRGEIPGAASKAADLGGERPLPSIARFRTASLSDGRDQLTLMCSAGDRPAKAKVRSLVVWMAGWRERKFSEVLKAHRQGLPWGDHESPGRNNSKRKCSLENARSEGRAHHRRAKVAWDAEI